MSEVTYVQPFDDNFTTALLPELILVAGLFALIIIPNLGKATFRVPGTQIRLPYFLGGERYSLISNPRLPSWIAVTTLVLAFVEVMMAFESGLQRYMIVSELLPTTINGVTTGDVLVNGGSHILPSGSKELLLINGFSRLFEMIFFGAISLAAIASMNRLQSFDSSDRSTNALYNNRRQADFYILLLTTAMGMAIVALAQDLFVLFLGLELASFSSYVLVAFHKESKEGTEGGMKYFIVGSVASGIGLYGLSMLYLWAGTLQLGELSVAFDAAMAPQGTPALPLIALGFILVGFGFKVSAAPFHFAAPDAYAGASSPVAGILATASKAMGIVGLTRMLLIVASPESNDGSAIWLVALGILSVVTMTWGNIAALGSDNPKRMLAYSSVAHAGYMLAGLTAIGAWNWDPTLAGHGGDGAIMVMTAILFHLVVLVCFKLGAFLVLSILESEGEVSKMSSLRGLSKREPLLAVSMFIFMISLAGVPPMSGFMSKLLMIMGIVKVAIGNMGDAISNGDILSIGDAHWVWWLALIMVLNSAISMFYYLRVIVTMYFHEPEGDRQGPLPSGWQVRAAIFACVVTSVFFGINADGLIELCEMAAKSLNYSWGSQ
jgi:NADH-quinone oxidoreductase subunit N